MERSRVTVLVDNGHGRDTRGKRSPDGRLMEWSWTRRASAMLVRELAKYGFGARLLVPEEADIPLSTRVSRANQICAKLGADKVLLVSLHCNASGSDGLWHEARGWSVFVSKEAGAWSCMLADCLANAVSNRWIKVRVPSARESYWRQGLYLLKNSACAAVLTENMFMDNLVDVDYLLTETGLRRIVDAHVAGVEAYFRKRYGE